MNGSSFIESDLHELQFHLLQNGFHPFRQFPVSYNDQKAKPEKSGLAYFQIMY